MILDILHKHFNQYRESVIVKPTDLGPIYKEPVLAEAYITAVESSDEFMNVH